MIRRVRDEVQNGEGVGVEERAMRGTGMKVVVNGLKFVVCIGDEVFEFKNEGIKRAQRGRGYVMKKTKGDVGGSLNDRSENLRYIFIFQ